ncbi:dipeptidase PepV [Allofustis seminis]|uniref:dipeptidase PepV n=1 Tax=Allofustis seminis TaxID=166939 RepID=UPI00036395C5|nr:dipeptidase PepV [Allofustis seminis]
MTALDYKKIVADYQEDFLNDLFELLRVPSVREDDQATAEFPVGPGPAKALHKFLEFGKRDGFTVQNFDNWAGHIEMGEGNELMGILGHVDVVPVGTGWDTDPFEPVLKEGRIYARGSSDDKGPSLAAYYALKIIKDLKLPVAKKIRLIIGTDEESGWQCMDHYFSVEKMPDFGFSPDAVFPIINGEKGNVTVQLHFGGNQSGDIKLIRFESGLRSNMVPQDAEATLEVKDLDAVIASFEEFLTSEPITGSYEQNGTQLILHVVGKAAHGSTPEVGINGATYLGKFLQTLGLSQDAKTFVDVTAQVLHDDPKGEKLGVAMVDDVMGELSANAGVFRFEEGKGGTITINMRYPKGTDEEITQKITQQLASYDVTVEKAAGGKLPHYVSPEDPLVKTLLDVYHRQTGLEAHEQVIGGGTYGRLMDRGVAYGALFPDSIDTMHQANEFMALDDLMRSMAIYLEAIYELVRP